MNDKIYKILENEINTFASEPFIQIMSNSANFLIFQDSFNEIRLGKIKDDSIKLIAVLSSNCLYNGAIDILTNSCNSGGIVFLVKFEGAIYSIGFLCWRENLDVKYKISIRGDKKTKLSGTFLYKYFLFSALEHSKLKGKYFTMPRNQFSWELKTIEPRTFDDIYLPESIMSDLNMYVDIYKSHGKLFRYLKVGNPGVGKTESTIVIANELNKLGVTIIKTNMCEKLHEKVELAKVLAPSLIIFDDLDISLGSRNSGGFSQLLGDFLDVLDGTDKLGSDVGIIATTNAAHLLDIAAQRPGRFDKIILYDNISEDNIKNIILKSIRHNFEPEYDKLAPIFSNKMIVKKLYDSKCTGSHIFNMVKMIKLKFDSTVEDITVDKIIESFMQELGIIEKIRKQSRIEDKMNQATSSIGFAMNGSAEDADVFAQ